MQIFVTQELTVIPFIPIIISYLYGIFVAHLFVSLIVNSLWVLTNPKDRTPFEKAQSGILGVIERVIYISSLFFQASPFIAIWLSLKTVSKWKPWQTSKGRKIFNNFLIGNGLNLLFSFSSYLFIRASIDLEIIERNYSYAGLLFAPMLLSTIIWLWIKSLKKNNNSHRQNYSSLKLRKP
jgi:hypothetical protein